MAHAQKLDFVFPRNGRVHLNRWGRQFSRLLADEVCASAWVMLDIPRSEVAWEYWLPTPFASFPFTSPPVRHRMPPGSEWALLKFISVKAVWKHQRIYPEFLMCWLWKLTAQTIACRQHAARDTMLCFLRVIRKEKRTFNHWRGKAEIKCRNKFENLWAV